MVHLLCFTSYYSYCSLWIMQILHSKLSTSSDATASSTVIKSVLLYDGSITIFDSRLYGFDIGTCLEVLGYLSDPRILLRFGAGFNKYIEGYCYNLSLLLIACCEVTLQFFTHEHFSFNDTEFPVFCNLITFVSRTMPFITCIL